MREYETLYLLSPDIPAEKAEEINKMLRELGELSPDEAGSLDEHYQRFLRDQAFDAESERVYERKDPK